MNDAQKMWDEAVTQADKILKLRQFEENNKELLSDIRKNASTFLIEFSLLQAENIKLKKENEYLKNNACKCK